MRTANGGAFKRALVVLVALIFTPLLGAGVANAHGEQTQEAFLRASTVLMYDVNFSKTGDVNVGDEITITGNLRIMDSWPDHVIKEAKIGYLSIVAPGPKFLVKERWLNGQFTPQSVQIHKGETFPFKLVIQAREEGNWHVHPSFAVEGTGTLVGRGEWLNVHPGTLTNTVELASGKTVDLDNYGLWNITIWHVVTIGIALAWLLYWLWKPLISRLPRVASGDVKLVTKVDRRVALGIAGAVIVALVIGNVWVRSTADVDPMPLQVDRIEPKPAAEVKPLVESTIEKAQYNRGDDMLDFTLKVKNTSAAPVELSQLQIAEVTFVPVGEKVHGTVEGLQLTGGSVAPGAESEIHVRIDGKIMKEHNLLPLKEPQVKLTGLMFFTDTAGHRQVSEIDEVTSPIFPGK